MKVTLTFNLPDDTGAMECALHGQTYVCALLDIDDALRSHIKHGSPLTMQELRDQLYELLAATPWRG